MNIIIACMYTKVILPEGLTRYLVIMEQMMQHFKLQPQKETVRRRHSLSVDTERRLQPFCSEVPREKPSPSYLKRGPPNAIVLPAGQTERMADFNIHEFRKRQSSENASYEKNYSDINNAKRILCNGQQARWFHSRMRQQQQQQQQQQQSQFISVIKVSPRVEQRGLSQILESKTKSQYSEDYAVPEVRMNGFDTHVKRTHNASTQTDSCPVSSDIHSTDKELTLRKSVGCQTDVHSSQEEPQMIPLVTPPLYGIDPSNGNAVSLVFHFRVPSQAAQSSKLDYKSDIYP